MIGVFLASSGAGGYPLATLGRIGSGSSYDVLAMFAVPLAIVARRFLRAAMRDSGSH